MAPHRIVFIPEARDQLESLQAYITTAADAEIASRFVSGIIDHVAMLTDFPNRGTPRDDIRAELRTIIHGSGISRSPS